MVEEKKVEKTEEKTQKLTEAQEINILAQAHSYFSNFDGIKGSQAANFARVLDAVASVVNSLVIKEEESKKEVI